jgi:hypothetical protein
VSEEDRLNKLVEKLDEYIAFIGEEIDELVVLASNRGWKSTRYDGGEKLRGEIRLLRKPIVTP